MNNDTENEKWEPWNQTTPLVKTSKKPYKSKPLDSLKDFEAPRKEVRKTKAIAGNILEKARKGRMKREGIATLYLMKLKDQMDEMRKSLDEAINYISSEDRD